MPKSQFTIRNNRKQSKTAKDRRKHEVTPRTCKNEGNQRRRENEKNRTKRNKGQLMEEVEKGAKRASTKTKEKEGDPRGMAGDTGENP